MKCSKFGAFFALAKSLLPIGPLVELLIPFGPLQRPVLLNIILQDAIINWLNIIWELLRNIESFLRLSKFCLYRNLLEDKWGRVKYYWRVFWNSDEKNSPKSIISPMFFPLTTEKMARTTTAHQMLILKVTKNSRGILWPGTIHFWLIIWILSWGPEPWIQAHVFLKVPKRENFSLAYWVCGKQKKFEARLKLKIGGGCLWAHVCLQCLFWKIL